MKILEKLNQTLGKKGSIKKGNDNLEKINEKDENESLNLKHEGSDISLKSQSEENNQNEVSTITLKELDQMDTNIRKMDEFKKTHQDDKTKLVEKYKNSVGNYNMQSNYLSQSFDNVSFGKEEDFEQKKEFFTELESELKLLIKKIAKKREMAEKEQQLYNQRKELKEELEELKKDDDD